MKQNFINVSNILSRICRFQRKVIDIFLIIRIAKPRKLRKCLCPHSKYISKIKKRKQCIWRPDRFCPRKNAMHNLIIDFPARNQAGSIIICLYRQHPHIFVRIRNINVRMIFKEILKGTKSTGRKASMLRYKQNIL